MSPFGKLLTLSALIASLATITTAHTWIEEYQVIGPNGSYIGDRGYSRGYVARTDPTFDGDGNILWMLPELAARMPDTTVRLRINSTDNVCHPNQRVANYSNPEYPKLKVAPGTYVAAKYLENGHVTLPWNVPAKPLAGGTVYVYGTLNPSPDEKIADVLLWNKNGTSGNRKGWLMTVQNFDDGRCHQINDCRISAERQVLYPNMIPDQPTSPGQEQWCETDIYIPKNQKLGSLTTYWVWQWPTQPNEDCTYPDGKDEYYTTCADFEIVGDSPGDVKIATEVATNTLLQEDWQTKAVSTYMARTALTSSRPMILDNWPAHGGVSGKTNAVNPSWSSACATQTLPGARTVSCPPNEWATGALFASISNSVLAAAKTQVKVNLASITTTALGLMPVDAVQKHPVPTSPPAHAGLAGGKIGEKKPAVATILYTSKVTRTTYVTTVVTGSLSSVADTSSAVAAAASGTPAVIASGSNVAISPQAVSSYGNIPTVKTVYGKQAAASSATAQDAKVGDAGMIGEHVVRHRRHARHFE